MTNHKPGCSRLWLCSILLTLALGLSHESAFSATFVVTNINSPGQGFNDTTVVAPVTGNPATTLGAQRMAVFQAAADTWGALLVSPVSIVVSAQMTSLNCSAFSAVLGSAGAASIFRDFSGAPLSNTWYPAALASSLSGSDLDPGGPDINANFNQDIGQPNCLNNLPWSYVIGAAAPANTISFFDTVVHEIGHGVGVFSLVSLTTGALGSGNRNDSYTQHLLDETPSPSLWTALTNSERVAAAIDTGNLTWNGSSVNAVSGLLTAGRHGTSNRVRMHAPNPLQPGSSVSHFDTALTPNEIMEPSLTSVNRRRLSNHLMLDLGWRAHVNLAISKTDSVSSISAGSATSYTITIQNNSLADLTAVNLGVTDTMPAALQGVTWTCAGLAGATCAVANGAGNINTTVTIPQGASVSFSVSAIISAAFAGTLANTANLVLPANLQNSASSSASDNTTVTPAPPPPGVTVSTISGNTTEAGGTATFSVVLNTQPSADVNIGLSSNDTTEGTVSPATFTFTSGNWATPQVVTVTGVNDDVDDGDVNYSITTAAATSSDSNYQGINPADVGVTNTDNDTAGITVSAISGNTTEAGGTATFSVVLNTQPSATVNVGLSSNDTTEGTITQSSIAFTAGNWATPQVVTVTGVNDDVDDGDVNYSIITAAATSSDSNYQGINPADVSVTNLDDDTAGITASAISGNTTEAGGTATFSVVLNTQPSADVNIGLSSNDTTEGTVSPATLTFTSGNWATPQVVTVTGVNDDIDDGDVIYAIITAAATSSDSNYQGINPADVSVTNLDDDTAGIEVSLASGDTGEIGTTATFTIELDSEPTHDVTIELSSSDPSEGLVTPSSVSFTAAAWFEAKVLTITGQDDGVKDGPIGYTIITAAAISQDLNYSGIDPDDVNVINQDDDSELIFADGFESP